MQSSIAPDRLSRHAIISELYQSKNFCDCINKFDQAHLREDLKQEVALIICAWPDDRVIELHRKGELNFYVVRVILNQMQSSTSPFYKIHRRSTESYEEIDVDESATGHIGGSVGHTRVIQLWATEKQNAVGEDIEDRAIKELVEDFTLEQIERLPFYEREMVKLYMKAGSYRLMEKATRIPHESCHKTVRRALDKLRKMGEVKKATNVFTKEELNFIQNSK